MNDFEKKLNQQQLSERHAEWQKAEKEKRLQALTKGERALVEGWSTGLEAQLRTALAKSKKNPSVCLQQEFAWVVEKIIPEKEREMVFSILDNIREYPYAIGYGRRSYRANSYALYAAKIERILLRYLKGDEYPYPLEKRISRDLPEDVKAYLGRYFTCDEPYTSYEVAYALDIGDKKVEEAVVILLTEQNGTEILTRELIEGILCSHRADMHELLGKVLLAAKLQEGLRQAICESADEGTKEGFLAILRVIDENNLIRYSSIKRAVGTWLGLLSEEVRDLERVSDKSVRLIVECLESENARKEYLHGEDAMALYISLWSMGFDSVERAFEEVQRLEREGSKHQCMVAGYFAMQTDAQKLAHRLALETIALRGQDNEIFSIWQNLLFGGVFSWMFTEKGKQRPQLEEYFKDKEEARAVAGLLEEKRKSIQGKSFTFSPILFPWLSTSLKASRLAELYCMVAALVNERAMLEYASTLLIHCSADSRSHYFEAVLRNPQGEIMRGAVLDGLADKSTWTREAAAKIAQKMQLTAAEYRKIEEHLRFKAEDIRNNILFLLMKQTDSELKGSISRLLAGEKEELRLAGLDIIAQLKKDSKRKHIAEEFFPQLQEYSAKNNLPAKEGLLLESIFPVKTLQKTLFERRDRYIPDLDAAAQKIAEFLPLFAEYFPDSKLPSLLGEKKNTVFGSLKGIFARSAAVCPTAKQAMEDLKSLSAYIERNKTQHYRTESGADFILGERWPIQYDYNPSRDKMPLQELWDSWAQENKLDFSRLFRMAIRLQGMEKKAVFKECAADIRTVFGAGFEEKMPSLPHDEKIEGILSYFLSKISAVDKEKLGAVLGLWFLRFVPQERVALKYSEKIAGTNWGHFITHPQLAILFGSLQGERKGLRENTFPIAVAVAERCLQPVEGREYCLQTIDCGAFSRNLRLLSPKAYLYALLEGKMSERAFYEFAFREKSLSVVLSTLSTLLSAYKEREKTVALRRAWYSFSLKSAEKELVSFLEQTEDEEKAVALIEKLYENISSVVLEKEYKRGDSPTEYSYAVHDMERLYGAEQFACILQALGNDTLTRSTYYYGNYDSPTRSENLSYLLSVCLPREGESVDTLRAALANKNVSEKRLIEGALYAPEWISLVGEYLSLPAFESTCYYFIAHMNERFEDKRRAMIAKYTPLSEDELNHGAFDRGWFESAYREIGEKRFEKIYEAAKYISDGAKHARARKFADATLGKFTMEELEKSIQDKRNKDLLLAYALLPTNGEEDIIRRYLYIEQFQKQSKSFGAQRMASEGKAAEMAKKNLALTAGYADEMRLTLRMESKIVEDNRALLQPKLIEGVLFTLSIDDNGKAELCLEREGKVLKSIPASLKKNQQVIALTAFKKTLTEQYARAKRTFEEAMENGATFTMKELSELSFHPVVYPILKKLLFLGETGQGFPVKGGLQNAKGEVLRLPEDTLLTIAHPVQLFERGIWREYQTYLFEKQIVQPFRQVFREVYVKTEEEKGGEYSLRYAGNQLQPAKTLATLKTRRWVADVENGLQKVYYKENIVAQMYALADWFSPADIEAPTLEWVCFSDRKTNRLLKIDEVPNIIFSEIMRDVDLAVSVAHAGGVDPEASHSTMEMRAAILECILPIFKLTNVTVENNRAMIKGKRAEYSVHLGSGVVHQIGGSMIAVLPVHSSHRGRIFLPFIDDDPKTSEIISKVLLFAEDGAIKDPSILSQIQGN